jgi:hypothetical protein
MGSNYATNLRKVEQFVQSVVEYEGESAGKDGENASIYVCGGSGTGKRGNR